MSKKRRKLNKDFERKYIHQEKCRVGLAKIYDIEDEDIQKDYISAFNQVVYLYDQLKDDYEKQGFNDNSGEFFKLSKCF